MEASKISDAQIKKYWKRKEDDRIAARVHQRGLSVHEKVLREFDLSSQFGVGGLFSTSHDTILRVWAAPRLPLLFLFSCLELDCWGGMMTSFSNGGFHFWGTLGVLLRCIFLQTLTPRR